MVGSGWGVGLAIARTSVPRVQLKHKAGLMTVSNMKHPREGLAGEYQEGTLKWVTMEVVGG